MEAAGVANHVCTTDWTIIWTIIGTTIGSIVAIFGINIALFNWLRSDILNLETRVENRISSLESKFENKISSLEERMFYLSTGKTLSQAILEEKMKTENKKA